MGEYTIILYYKYVKIPDSAGLVLEHKKVCKQLGLKGRIIIAPEGINGTLDGPDEKIKEYEAYLTSNPLFADVYFKVSKGLVGIHSFPKLSIKLRDEIVTSRLGEDDLHPSEITGKRLTPSELKEWFERGEDFTIVDMRNDYEHNVGHFKGSLLPDMQNFRDLPRITKEIEGLKSKKVITVCTGGVRCEKASGYLVKKGFEDVYQLDGGIVSYLEKYPNSEFKGSLYVFDERVTMTFDDPNKHEIIGKCALCSMPTETYVNCKDDMCHFHFICCGECRDEDGKAFCVKCKNKVQV